MHADGPAAAQPPAMLSPQRSPPPQPPQPASQTLRYQRRTIQPFSPKHGVPSVVVPATSPSHWESPQPPGPLQLLFDTGVNGGCLRVPSPYARLRPHAAAQPAQFSGTK
eukprot:jgi/Ulvmu1/30/UM001_0031.1